MTNDQRMPSTQCPSSACRFPRQLDTVIGHWCLVIHWSLGTHWPLGIGHSMVIGHWASVISERCHFFPNAMQPALALVVANRAFGDESDTGDGDVEAEDGVVGADI